MSRGVLAIFGSFSSSSSINVIRSITNHYDLPFISITNVPRRGYYEQLRQHGKCTHHMIMMIHAFFMDLYTIGQLMNPKYKYCVFFGGCGHTRSILRAMDLMNILKKTGNEYVTCPVSFYPLIARKGVLF